MWLYANRMHEGRQACHAHYNDPLSWQSFKQMAFSWQEDVNMSLELPSLMLSPRSTTEILTRSGEDKEQDSTQKTNPTERDALLTPLRPTRTDSTSDE